MAASVFSEKFGIMDYNKGYLFDFYSIYIPLQDMSHHSNTYMPRIFMSNLLSFVATCSESIVYIQRFGKNLDYAKKVIIFITMLIF